ncbi:hypothetical protein ACEQPO_02805 [Bacillus sp. SL00103]
MPAGASQQSRLPSLILPVRPFFKYPMAHTAAMAQKGSGINAASLRVRFADDSPSLAINACDVSAKNRSPNPFSV